MQQIYGGWAGKLVTALIIWTAFGSVFSLLLGYSRVPYAAALDGNYFAVFARLHKVHRFPYVSLLVLGRVAAAFCVLRLADVIAALVVIRHAPAISAAACGPADPAQAPSGNAAAVQDVVLSGAGAAGHRRIFVRAGFAPEFSAGDSLCGGGPGAGSGAVFCSRGPAREWPWGQARKEQSAA